MFLGLVVGVVLSARPWIASAKDGSDGDHDDGGHDDGGGNDDGGNDDGGHDDGDNSGGDDSGPGGGDDSGGDNSGGDSNGGGRDDSGSSHGRDKGRKHEDVWSQDKALRERQLGRVIPLRKALDIVEARVRGRVIDVDLVARAGRPQYRVKVRRTDGVIQTVRLDARTGRVLGFLGF